MIDFLKKNWYGLLLFIRKQLVIGFGIAFYFLSVYTLFISGNILLGLLFSILFFSSAHFLMLELKRADISTILMVVIILTLVNIVFVGFGNFFYVLGVGLFHVAIFFLIWDIYEELYNRIEISSYKVFTMGVKMYSLLLSFVFAFSFLGTYTSFNLTCDQIYKGVNNFSKKTLSKIGIELPKLEDTKVQKIVDNLKVNKNILTGNYLSGTTLSGNVLTGNIQIPKTETSFNGIQNMKLTDIFKLDFWKSIIVNQIMENKKILDKSVCSIIVENIKEKYKDPRFQFTVIFLIFLLFYPFIRIFLYILSIINLIVFKILNWLKLYQYKIVVEDVEVIE